MSQEDADYFIMRAEKERAMAQKSNDPIVRAVHRQLAELYDERLTRYVSGLPLAAE